MWPDDDRVIPFPSGTADPELDALAEALAAAGEQARRTSEPPSRGFADDLRATLLAAYPAERPMAGAGAGVSERPVLHAARPRVTRRPRTQAAPSFGRVGRSSWAALAIAAAIVVAVVGLGPRTLLGGPLLARSVDAAGAMLDRAGSRAPLSPGVELRVGDVITTDGASGSHATLGFGLGETRLAAAASVQVVTLDGDEGVVVQQLAGRVWHRVGSDVRAYAVATGDVTWTATGTAFDLDRTAASDAIERVRAVGVEHNVRVAGPDLGLDLVQGSVAIVRLGSDARLEQVDPAPLTVVDGLDPWLLANARRDVGLGYDPGALGPWLEATDAAPLASRTPDASVTESTQTDTPSTGPTGTASADPSPTSATSSPTAPDATASATPRPTERPTPKPTPKPPPKPTPKPPPKPEPTPEPTPTIGPLGLDATGCHGGFVVLRWSAATADGFSRYQTLRSSSASIAPVVPPEPPAVAPDSLSIAERATLGAVDRGLDPGTRSYRTLAIGAENRTLAASPVRTVTVRAVKALGSLGAAADGGSVVVEWAPYDGPAACFSVYKLAVSTSTESPSALEGADVLWSGEAQGTGGTVVDGLAPGTYHLRLQAIRTTETGKLLVAQSDPATITIP